MAAWSAVMTLMSDYKSKRKFKVFLWVRWDLLHLYKDNSSESPGPVWPLRVRDFMMSFTVHAQILLWSIKDLRHVLRFTSLIPKWLHLWILGAVLTLLLNAYNGQQSVLWQNWWCHKSSKLTLLENDIKSGQELL